METTSTFLPLNQCEFISVFVEIFNAIEDLNKTPHHGTKDRGVNDLDGFPFLGEIALGNDVQDLAFDLHFP